MNEFNKFYIRLQLIFDLASVILIFILAWFIRYHTPLLGESVYVVTFSYYLRVLIFIVPLYLVLHYLFGLYSDKQFSRLKTEAIALVKADTISLLIVIVSLYVLKQVHVARSMLVLFYVINLVVEIATRKLFRQVRRKNLDAGKGIRNILLIGYSNSAEKYIERVKDYPEWGYRICGILDDTLQEDMEICGVPVIGRTGALPLILEKNKIDEIVITMNLSQYFRLEQIVSICEKSGVHTKFVPDYGKIVPGTPYAEDMMGLPVINIRYVPLSNFFNAGIKRLGDIIGSLLLIGISSPVMLVCVIGIKATMPGPLIFRQVRVGLHNRTFEMYKFRSMIVQKESEEKKAWTTKDDPRVTKFGSLMRRTSMDELPQFFNVLKGEMSLVGPRPERPYFVEKFKEEVPRYMIKHQVRPGVTGWAQVNGLRGDTSITKRIEYDLYYIEHWNWKFDFKILFMTVFKGNKNAY